MSKLAASGETRRDRDVSGHPFRLPPPSRELVDWMRDGSLPAGLDLPTFLSRYDGEMNATGAPAPEYRQVSIRKTPDWDLRVGVWMGTGYSRPPGVVLHIHGGGWRMGNHLTHRGLAAVLVQAGFTVVSVDYRRAPKFRFPAAYDDSRAALEWCATCIGEFGADPNSIAVLGDSAGANLAAALAVDQTIDVVRSAVLIYGIYEYESALIDFARHGYLPDYVPAADVASLRSDIRLNPIRAAAKFPPTLLSTGDQDWLLHQSILMHDALKSAGVDHEYRVLPATPHGYIQLPGHPGYNDGMTDIIRFLHRHIGNDRNGWGAAGQ